MKKTINFKFSIAKKNNRAIIEYESQRKSKSKRRIKSKVRISDVIEQFIDNMFDEENEAIIQRNDLATRFNCVPSQINYVISTRFTPIQGYYVESQRGGGGYIRIVRTQVNEEDAKKSLLNKIGDKLTVKEANSLLEILNQEELITDKELKIFKSLVTDNCLSTIKIKKEEIRANILKNIIINL